MLINPSLAIIVFVVILIIAVFISHQMESYHHYDKSRFHIFIGILTGLGVFVTFMFYYNVVEIQQQQQQSIRNQEISRINDSLGAILGEQYVDTIPRFVYDINPLARKNVNVESFPPEENEKQVFDKYTLSHGIFSAWDDFKSSKQLSNYDESGVLSGFLQKASSHLLYNQWKEQKFLFDSTTRKLGDLLFSYGLSIEDVYSGKSFMETALIMMNSNVYSEIINNKSLFS